MMRARDRRHLVIFEHTDGTVDFEHRERDLGDVSDAVLAQRLMQIVAGQFFFGQILVQNFSVANEQSGRAFNQAAKFSMAPRHARQHRIHDQTRRRGNQSADKRGGGSGHRILLRVRQPDEHGQIQRHHLPDFALAGEPQPEQAGTKQRC